MLRRSGEDESDGGESRPSGQPAIVARTDHKLSSVPSDFYTNCKHGRRADYRPEAYGRAGVSRADA